MAARTVEDVIAAYIDGRIPVVSNRGRRKLKAGVVGKPATNPGIIAGGRGRHRSHYPKGTER